MMADLLESHGRKTTKALAFERIRTAKTTAGRGTVKHALTVALQLGPVIGHSISASQKGRGTCVNPNKLQAAFSLIEDFKQGKIKSGEEISDEQIELLQCLCEDLLPTQEFSTYQITELIEEIVRTNSHWNQRTQLVIDEFYTLNDAGKINQAQQRLRDFLDECPSAWYRGIVNAL